MKLSAAQRLAESHGLSIIEHRYPSNRSESKLTLLWMICHGDREVGHWVPGTGCYRALRVYGGPATLQDVLAKLAVSVGLALAETRPSRDALGPIAGAAQTHLPPRTAKGGRPPVTHCKRGGHEYTPDNTRIKNGGKICLTCQREHVRAAKARKRQSQQKLKECA